MSAALAFLWKFRVILTLTLFIGALVGLEIGSRKNRMLQGTLLGAFLGPIGWVAIALLSRRNFRQCPACGISTNPVSEDCIHCGADLAAEDHRVAVDAWIAEVGKPQPPRKRRS